ncbi:hypothetical protein SLA2020_122880 [Shorea laevis]
MYHNKHLKQAMKQLRKQHPNVIIVYADYKAIQRLLGNNNRFYFDPNSVKKACCGMGGYYNFSFTRFCGALRVTVCPNPDEYVSWDGLHLRQKAYKIMTRYPSSHHS